MTTNTLVDAPGQAPEANDLVAPFKAPFSLDANSLEMRQGKPVCTLDVALKLIAEFNRLFPNETPMGIISNEWIKRDDEKGIFQRAYHIVHEAFFAEHGFPPGTKLDALSDDLKRLYMETCVSGRRSNPNLLVVFAEGSVVSVEELFSLLDEQKDPYGKLHATTCVNDARIDIGHLIARMSHYTNARSLFSRLFPQPCNGETEAMRVNFRRLIDELLGSIGLGEAGPGFTVLHMGPPSPPPAEIGDGSRDALKLEEL